MATPGTFMWNELVTPDTAAARDFYTKVFGWSTEEMPLPNPADGIYTIFRHSGEPVAGMLDIRSTGAPDGTPAHWFNYLCVEDAGAACRAITEAGGTVYRDPFVIAGAGTLAIVADAGGSTFGIMQPESKDPTG